MSSEIKLKRYPRLQRMLLLLQVLYLYLLAWVGFHPFRLHVSSEYHRTARVRAVGFLTFFSVASSAINLSYTFHLPSSAFPLP